MEVVPRSQGIEVDPDSRGIQANPSSRGIEVDRSSWGIEPPYQDLVILLEKHLSQDITQELYTRGLNLVELLAKGIGQVELNIEDINTGLQRLVDKAGLKFQELQAVSCRLGEISQGHLASHGCWQTQFIPVVLNPAFQLLLQPLVFLAGNNKFYKQRRPYHL